MGQQSRSDPRSVSAQTGCMASEWELLGHRRSKAAVSLRARKHKKSRSKPQCGMLNPEDGLRIGAARRKARDPICPQKPEENRRSPEEISSAMHAICNLSGPIEEISKLIKQMRDYYRYWMYKEPIDLLLPLASFYETNHPLLEDVSDMLYEVCGSNTKTVISALVSENFHQVLWDHLSLPSTFDLFSYIIGHSKVAYEYSMEKGIMSFILQHLSDSLAVNAIYCFEHISYNMFDESAISPVFNKVCELALGDPSDELLKQSFICVGSYISESQTLSIQYISSGLFQNYLSNLPAKRPSQIYHFFRSLGKAFTRKAQVDVPQAGSNTLRKEFVSDLTMRSLSDAAFISIFHSAMEVISCASSTEDSIMVSIEIIGLLATRSSVAQVCLDAGVQQKFTEIIWSNYNFDVKSGAVESLCCIFASCSNDQAIYMLENGFFSVISEIIETFSESVGHSMINAFNSALAIDEKSQSEMFSEAIFGDEAIRDGLTAIANFPKDKCVDEEGISLADDAAMLMDRCPKDLENRM